MAKAVGLDFDDITGGKTRKKKAPPKKTQPKDNKKEIVLTLPGDEPGTYLFKDISECSGAEFKHWAARVYPDVSSLEVSKLETLSNRMRVFNQILRYHTTCLFHTGGKNQSNKNLNH